MKGLRFLVGLSLSLFVLTVLAKPLYSFDSPKQEAQFNHLLRELRCLVCQNQDLSDSNAPLAKDLRGEVYALVTAGKSDHDITNYLSERYGDFILFKPPVKGITLFLWFGPMLFLGIGFGIFWKTCFKRQAHE
ncbi:cytochrome c-type biogenesis protein [Legionella impletisoli]|uniref:Cytochrome c-type biogenesis protein n=1 Tax=Legionella impletisoli TaxID=343510 RepID=A0A917JND3_9GAMM|nr:cytochrome c-type biogenesis protein [Legionella impletisoli]GGI78707.1 cytochrome c biogenesis protein CcmH [Legionella impletisoli]